jgi:hypothetical protein
MKCIAAKALHTHTSMNESCVVVGGFRVLEEVAEDCIADPRPAPPPVLGPPADPLTILPELTLLELTDITELKTINSAASYIKGVEVHRHTLYCEIYI